MPFKVNKVTGDFNCNQNLLTSLEDCPKEVGGSFHCSGNQLTDLKGCPKDVGGDFDCSGNEIKSLENCPIEIGGNLNCSKNKLTKLDTVANVSGYIACYDNEIDPNNDGFNGWCGDKIFYDVGDYVREKIYLNN